MILDTAADTKTQTISTAIICSYYHPVDQNSLATTLNGKARHSIPDKSNHMASSNGQSTLL